MSKYYDQKRMEKALKSKIIEIPKNLTREEKRDFIIKSSKSN
jgi:hypothetical protein